jgi:hypothetical protein
VVGYDNIPGGHQLTLLYNHNGESIADVGILGLPQRFTGASAASSISSIAGT